MLESIQNKKMADLGISTADEILEIGVQDDHADQMAVDYIKKVKDAKQDKNSLIYKSCLIKQSYKSSDIHKAINRIINQLEPLRLIIKRETIEMQDAAEAGNKESEQKIMKVVAQRKAEHSKLEKQLSALMSSADKLQLAS